MLDLRQEVNVYSNDGARAAHPVRGEMSRILTVHGTPDGVRALAASVAINMALLTEGGSHTAEPLQRSRL